VSALRIANAEVDGRPGLDVRVEDGRITALAPRLDRRPHETVIDAGGGAVLPGLHDHHIHLFALAAAAASVACGPPDVVDADALRVRLRAQAQARAAAPDAWIRGIGYHESVAGELERGRLDAMLADRPVRIQHRSGMLWMLNAAAIDRLGLDGDGPTPPGVERDRHGRVTGRLWRLDEWLRDRLGTARPPDFKPVGTRLARCGVTGVTDATPGNGAAELRVLAAAADTGALPQRLLVMGSAALPAITHPYVARGAVKIMLDDHALPALAALRDEMAAAHAAARAVAVHCVTRAALVLAATALREAGARAGDRIEHAALAPPELLALLAALPVTVVTQPGFVRERGDAYLRDVAADERRWLYRCRGVLDAGIPLGGGSDAPFGDPNPWHAMQAAVERRTAGGALLGGDERLTPEQALALFTARAAAPGAVPRAVAPGAPADLCVLERRWADARRALDGVRVRATVVAGRVVWDAHA
jgi:predicted amidohydrolase YtcJ